MLNEKAIQGLTNAPVEKRYKSFINTVTDRGLVWISCCDYNLKPSSTICLWPYKEVCIFDQNIMSDISSIEIHEFIDALINFEDNYVFNVFPTNNNSCLVSKKKLHRDILESLNQIE